MLKFKPFFGLIGFELLILTSAYYLDLVSEKFNDFINMNIKKT